MPISLQLDLAGFTEPELAGLAHRLQFAADQARHRLDERRHTERNRCFYPGQEVAQAAPDRPPLTSNHWTRLIRETWYFSNLVTVVEAALDHQAGAPCLSDEPPSRLDLSTLPAGNDNAPFIAFLEKELRRSHLALAYVHRETFSAPIKQDLLPALTLERRFFSRLLQAIKPEAI